tara:strand:- start:324 stop:563 length:240 start_codon:yes stop_codon:yes gene_type:complete
MAKKKQKMVIIKLSESKYNQLLQAINKLDDVLDRINEMNEMFLSDVSRLNDVRYTMTDILDLHWNNEARRYEQKTSQSD